MINATYNVETKSFFCRHDGDAYRAMCLNRLFCEIIKEHYPDPHHWINVYFTSGDKVAFGQILVSNPDLRGASAGPALVSFLEKLPTKARVAVEIGLIRYHFVVVGDTHDAKKADHALSRLSWRFFQSKYDTYNIN